MAGGGKRAAGYGRPSSTFSEMQLLAEQTRRWTSVDHGRIWQLKAKADQCLQ